MELGGGNDLAHVHSPEHRGHRSRYSDGAGASVLSRADFAFHCNVAGPDALAIFAYLIAPLSVTLRPRPLAGHGHVETVRKATLGFAAAGVVSAVKFDCGGLGSVSSGSIRGRTRFGLRARQGLGQVGQIWRHGHRSFTG